MSPLFDLDELITNSSINKLGNKIQHIALGASSKINPLDIKNDYRFLKNW